MKEMPQEKLSEKYITLLRINRSILIIPLALICIIPLVIASTAFYGVGIWLILVIALFAIWFVLGVLVMPQLRWKYFAYASSPDELDIAQGIFWKRHDVVPLIRVQDVDTRQGPIMRKLGLSSVTVSTAAGDHNIPGLVEADAIALREHLAYLARLAREEI